MQPNSVSLIVTTYNWPRALELVLLSIKQQSVLPNEVIIADDGSGQETLDLITQFQSNFPVPLIHSWQEDDGFRLARSRNLAIAKAKSDYIVMIDGDMLLHRHFIRDHKNISKPNYFVQGRRVILTDSITQELFKNKQIHVPFFSPYVKNKLNAVSCVRLSPLMTKLLSKKDHRSVRGCNMAYSRSNIVAINGYNEDFTGWGREDSEFVVRLLNSGVQRQDLRFGGVAYHLFHNENDRSNLNGNDQLLEFTIKNNICYCDKGINLHLMKSHHEGEKND